MYVTSTNMIQIQFYTSMKNVKILQNSKILILISNSKSSFWQSLKMLLKIDGDTFIHQTINNSELL